VEIKNQAGKTVKVLFRTDTRYIGLDNGAIIRMAEGMAIPVNQTFFENLSAFEQESLKILNGTANEQVCDKAQKERCTEEYGQYLDWTCKTCKTKKAKEKG